MALYDEIKAMRAAWTESDAKRDAGIPEPEGIRKIEDIVYTASVTKEEEPWHLTDIYYPEPWEGETYPLIVSIHGGGWFYGDKKLYGLYTKYLASKGFAVVNFNYRLAPEYRALFEEAKELTSPVPAKVALNCGVYELYGREDSRASANYLPEELSEKLSESITHVLDYLNGDFPETFLMASVNDSLLPASAVLKKKLEECGVPYEYHEYGQGNPADAHVFHVNLRSEEGKRCNKEELEFFLKQR